MAVIEDIVDEAPNATSSSSKPKFSYGHPGERNIDETLKSWDSVPLFMKDLPEDGGDSDTQAALEALQSLAFDGTPDEVASNFKTQGNEYFVSKRYREALGFYTQAIEASPTDTKLLETLHVNRAACHLELQNYGSCLRDTSATLGYNPRNEKAFYRAARALLALDKCVEAIDCCNHGIEIDAKNQAMKNLKTKAEARLKQIQDAEASKQERERRKRELDLALKQAFVLRGLWLETTPRPPDNPNPARFDPESLLPSSLDSIPLVGASTKWTPPDAIRTPVIFPVFFMYPQHAQSDFVSDYHEDTPVGVYLETMFPDSARGSLPWDTKGEYYASNLQVYATTKSMRLLKIGKKLSLRQVIDQGFQDAPAGKDKVKDRDGMVMRDGILSLVVLPKGDAEQKWINEFKAQRDKTKAK
ncbi:TPR-like protein [Testicularia cyperi]|uniref:TPR-like protein n=1 Tax=Testicularia cyperi TaxID=1882483 RepID=A0A317XZX4_9BASI|nr:TPR-like protein [Testicularia cyperi]